MNSRQRFLETMRYGSPDRVPYFEEGIRDEVLDSWYKQGLAPGTDPGQLFPTDLREEIETDLEPRPKPKKWPAAVHDLTSYRKRLDPEDHGRLPAPWADRIRQWKKRDHALLLRVHRGFFLSLGVFGWDRFTEVILRTVDDPEFIRESMRMQGEFAARMADRVLRQVTVDAAVFSEPIGGNTGPLISPDMYEDFCLKNYEPLLRVLNQHGVEVIVFRTFANARILIPGILKWGFNCLWACEVSVDAMDYRDLRREFGRDLRLIGGIDLDALRHSKEAIRKELEDKVPLLLEDGGYIPLADGRVREDVPFDHYVYYRERLDDIIRLFSSRAM
jgi:uroporphyrinogen decarboxylase